MDALAAPFVYGRLQEKERSFTVETHCAQSGRQITIELDSDLNISKVSPGSDPMFCISLVTLANTKQASIVDIF